MCNEYYRKLFLITSYGNRLYYGQLILIISRNSELYRYIITTETIECGLVVTLDITPTEYHNIIDLGTTVDVLLVF